MTGTDGTATASTADTDADGTDDVWDTSFDGGSDLGGTADSADEIGDGFGFGNDAGLNGRCNCSSEVEPAGGVLSLLGLGLLGLSLRRRRRE